MITAKKIDKIIKTGALHVLYREDGKWYNHLKYFPGVLFDINGYDVFKKSTEYINSPYLQHGKELNIPNGISQIPNYRKFTEEERNKVLNIE